MKGNFHRRGWQTSPVTRESTKETVKTIARGMPGVSGVTVVTTLVCSFNFACEAAGASRARHSLRPLLAEGGMFRTRLARKMRGEIAKLWLFEIRIRSSGGVLLSVLHGRARFASECWCPGRNRTDRGRGSFTRVLSSSTMEHDASTLQIFTSRPNSRFAIILYSSSEAPPS